MAIYFQNFLVFFSFFFPSSRSLFIYFFSSLPIYFRSILGGLHRLLATNIIPIPIDDVAALEVL